MKKLILPAIILLFLGSCEKEIFKNQKIKSSDLIEYVTSKNGDTTFYHYDDENRLISIESFNNGRLNNLSKFVRDGISNNFTILSQGWDASGIQRTNRQEDYFVNKKGLVDSLIVEYKFFRSGGGEIFRKSISVFTFNNQGILSKEVTRFYKDGVFDRELVSDLATADFSMPGCKFLEITPAGNYNEVLGIGRDIHGVFGNTYNKRLISEIKEVSGNGLDSVTLIQNYTYELAGNKVKSRTINTRQIQGSQIDEYSSTITISYKKN